MDRVRAFLESNLYLTLATVTPAGEPWSSPLFFAYDEAANLYIRSAIDSQHVQNILDNGKAFVTIFDSRQKLGEASGVYLQCAARSCETLEEAKLALAVMDARSGFPSKAEKFVGDGTKRVIKLTPSKVWENKAKVTDAGFMDYREYLTLENN